MEADNGGNVVVLRSVDAEEAARVQDLLGAQGIAAELIDDNAPGVPEGAWEVRVAAADVSRAEALMAAPPTPGDPTRSMDLIPVFRGAEESEVFAVQGMLESAGITTVIVGDQVLPNLPFEIRVAREQADDARAMIAQAPEQAAEVQE